MNQEAGRSDPCNIRCGYELELLVAQLFPHAYQAFAVDICSQVLKKSNRAQNSISHLLRADCRLGDKLSLDNVFGRFSRLAGSIFDLSGPTRSPDEYTKC
jgi:hypothetical protein